MNKGMRFLAIIALTAPLFPAIQAQEKRPVFKQQIDRIVSHQVKGFVKYNVDNKGAPGLSICLLEGDKNNPTWKMTDTTDGSGRYVFTIPPEKVGRELTLYAACDSLLEYALFAPNPIKFVAARGVTQLQDMHYTTPEILIEANLHMPNFPSPGSVLPNERVQLIYILNSQYIVIGDKQTDSYGTVKFTINSYNKGKEFVVRPVSGNKPFAPAEIRFALAKNEKFNFCYNGPLPDLTAENVQELAPAPQISECVKFSFIVRNHGNAPSSPCYLHYAWEQLDQYHRSQRYKEESVHIPSLAPGTLCTISGQIRSYPDWHIHLRFHEINPGKKVPESDFSNNYWPTK